MIALIAIWLFIILVLCFDLPVVCGMHKSRRKMRRFTLVPIFLVFIIPFFKQPIISEGILLKEIGTILAIIGFAIMILGDMKSIERD